MGQSEAEPEVHRLSDVCARAGQPCGIGGGRRDNGSGGGRSGREFLQRRGWSLSSDLLLGRSEAPGGVKDKRPTNHYCTLPGATADTAVFGRAGLKDDAGQGQDDEAISFSQWWSLGRSRQPIAQCAFASHDEHLGT